jgi:hypothetical protein
VAEVELQLVKAANEINALTSFDCGFASVAFSSIFDLSGDTYAPCVTFRRLQVVSSLLPLGVNRHLQPPGWRFGAMCSSSQVITESAMIWQVRLNWLLQTRGQREWGEQRSPLWYTSSASIATTNITPGLVTKTHQAWPLTSSLLLSHTFSHTSIHVAATTTIQPPHIVPRIIRLHSYQQQPNTTPLAELASYLLLLTYNPQTIFHTTIPSMSRRSTRLNPVTTEGLSTTSTLWDLTVLTSTIDAAPNSVPLVPVTNEPAATGTLKRRRDDEVEREAIKKAKESAGL